MYDASTVRSPIPRGRQATIFDACLAAAARSLRSLVTAIGRELRIRRDMRLLAELDDHGVEDIGLHRCVVVELSEPTLP